MSNANKARERLASIFVRPPSSVRSSSPSPSPPLPPPKLSLAGRANVAGGGGGSKSVYAEPNNGFSFGGGSPSAYINPNSNSPNFSGGRTEPLVEKGYIPDPGTGIILVFDLDHTLIDSSYVGFPITVEGAVRRLDTYKGMVNQTLIEKIMFPAAILRESYKVSAILMLTNNSSSDYVAGVCRYIYRDIKYRFKKAGIPISTITKGKYDETEARRTHRLPKKGQDVTELDDNNYFFDFIMTRLSDDRSGNPENPDKRLEDVAIMLRKLGKSTQNLDSRVFMFDDIADHVISKELNPPSNYIRIKSRDATTGAGVPFRMGLEEITDYSPVQKAFAELSDKPVSNLAGANTMGGGRRIRKRFLTRSKKSKRCKKGSRRNHKAFKLSSRW
jgi:hypothetical protein